MSEITEEPWRSRPVEYHGVVSPREVKCPVHAEFVSSDAPRPPRVKGLPFIGNTIQFLSDTARLMNEGYLTYGAVFRLRALWLRYTIMGGTEAKRFLQEGLADKYLSRHKIFDVVGDQLGSAEFVLSETGPRHVRLRRILSVAYSREFGSAFVPEFIEEVREKISRWKPGSVHSVMPAVNAIAFAQYCRAMCGDPMEEYYRDSLTSIEYIMNVGGRVWPEFTLKAPWYRSAKKRISDLLWKRVRERAEAGPVAGAPKTLIDTLLALRDKDGLPLTHDEVVCYSLYGFAGSVAYMGRLIGFMLYEILRDPDLKRSLTDEADRAFSGGLRNAADVRRMELHCAVYNETLRFHPISQGMPFYADQDFVFEGKKVCAGDITVISQVPMSFSDRCFRDPMRFDHTRMMNPRNEHRTGGGFHPFGIGIRTCSAMGLVELMAITMVATILHERDIEMAPANYRLKLTVRPLPAPDNAFRIKVETRDSKSGAALISEESITASFAGSDNPYVLQTLARAGRRVFRQGETIVRQGDTAEAFYIVESGTVTVSRLKNGADEILAQLGPGAYFGEIGLLHEVPRTATVVAATPSVETIELSRETFTELVEKCDLLSGEMAALVRKRTAQNSLRHALPGIAPESMGRILPEFSPEIRAAGETVIREGEAPDRFYIVVEGFAVVTRDGEEVARLGPGEYFGEIGLITGNPRNATVAISNEAPAKLLSTDRKGFLAAFEASDGMSGDLAQTMLRRLGRL